ncbi:MAG: porin family protein [Gammaproteobacteria bacterium]|nr:porin family protein [Gammaproteobacteria bacterium]
MKKQLCMLMASALVSTAAVADMGEGGYVGFDLSMVQGEMSFDEVPGSFDFNPVALRVKGGGTFNKYFGLEGYIGMGVQDDALEQSDYDIGIDNMIGLDALCILPVGNVLGLYGKVGVASFEYEDDYNDGYRESGLSYGVGARTYLGSMAVVVEYTVLPDIDEDGVEVESDMISVGFNFYP